MDWGAFIVLIVSVLGAAIIANGDFLLGIIAFLVIYCILAVIVRGVQSLLKTKKVYPPPTYDDRAKTQIILDEKHLEHMLDMIMEFLQAYSAAVPDEYYHVHISQDWRHNEYSGSSYYVIDGYLKFQIVVGNWWDGVLCREPDIEDYMKSTFAFDPDRRVFTCTNLRTGSSTCCAFPIDEVNKLLQAYLDNYEVKHPEVRFKRYSWGAEYSKNG